MKKNILFALAGISAAIFSSCTTIMPVAVSDAKVGTKTGVSKTGVVLGTLFLNNGYGIAEAVKNGKITGGVATIDEKTTNYIFFFTKELIVTGE